MSKTAIVQSNDPRQPSIVLRISGQVERFATIKPRVLRLKGTAGEKIRGSVRIIPEKKYPFRILGSAVKKGKHIQYTLSTVGGESGGYRVDVENLKESKGRYYDYIILNTDSEIQPRIRITVFARRS